MSDYYLFLHFLRLVTVKIGQFVNDVTPTDLLELIIAKFVGDVLEEWIIIVPGIKYYAIFFQKT